MKKTVVFVFVIILILMSSLYGCMKTKPPVTAEETFSPLPKESSAPVSVDVSAAETTVSNPDVYNKNVQIPETTVLVNELDNETGLFYLGLTKDEVISILEDNNIYFDAMEGDAGNYVIDFGLFDGSFLILFDEDNDLVNGIEVSGPTPVEATSTQSGLNIGDAFDKMVELYGNDYTMSYTQDKEYQIYAYKLADHYFEVWFQGDSVTSWRITS